MAIHKELVQGIFAKLASDTPNDFFDHVADGVSWEVLGTHPLAGHYDSKKAFREATFARLDKLFDEPLRLHTRSLTLDTDQNKVAVELYSNATSKNGVQFDNEYCWICEFDGVEIVSVRAYLDSALVTLVIEGD
jgi:hypothetical protein